MYRKINLQDQLPLPKNLDFKRLPTWKEWKWLLYSIFSVTLLWHLPCICLKYSSKESSSWPRKWHVIPCWIVHLLDWTNTWNLGAVDLTIVHFHIFPANFFTENITVCRSVWNHLERITLSTTVRWECLLDNSWCWLEKLSLGLMHWINQL